MDVISQETSLRFMPEMQSETRVRSVLTCTWHAFFARFPHLREIQKVAILPILKGESVVVNAPTASGKTEALMAPILERYLRNRPSNTKVPASTKRSQDGHHNTGKGPAILFIAPTKALCNDLFRRLRRPVTDLGLTITVRTGDNTAFKLDKPPVVLVTTPESLDSLIARKPAAFLYVHAIILDEIHLVSASGRGDQLQCLVSRLKILNDHPLQVCASSATVPELKRLTYEFLGPEGKTISCSGGTREIHASIRKIHADSKTAIHETADIIEQMLLESTERKIIVFCNARATVESLVQNMHARHRIAASVFAHHGSLSKETRLNTERQFLRARNAACVATSTLELGIDIGDVDRIVLLGPPPDVSSLIQRIGRGNRQQTCVNVVCLADCEFNVQRFLHLVECARHEMLFPDPISFRPTTIVQQAMSICLQNPQRWVGKQALYGRLSANAQKQFSVDDCGEILDQMTKSNLFRKVDKGRYVPEAKAQFMFNRGYMHTMIADRGETDVVDSVTGRTLGSVYLKDSSREAIATGAGLSVTLAGNAHTVSYFKDQKLFVKRGEEASDLGFLALEPPRYSLNLARNFATFMHVRLDSLFIKTIPKGLDLEHTFSQKDGELLDPSLAIAIDDITPGSEYIVPHFLGTIGGRLLQIFFEKNGYAVKKGSRTPFFLRLLTKPGLKKLPDEDHLYTHFELTIRSNVTTFARLLQPGPWLSIIPDNILLRWLISSLDIRSYAKALANLPVVLL